MLLVGLWLAGGTHAETLRTGPVTDLALEGPGMFLARRAGSAELVLTRAGSLRLGADGSLTTAGGDVLQGFNSTNDTVRKDLSVNLVAADDGEVVLTYSFASNGELRAQTTRGRTLVLGQVLLVWYPDLDRAAPRVGDWVHADTYEVPDDILGELTRWLYRPNQPPVGSILSGHLEIATHPSITRVSAKDLARERQLTYRTGREYDLAVRGPGWFLLRDPRTFERAVTRAGVFHLDAEGCLANPDGLRLQAEPFTGGLPFTWPADAPRYVDVQIPLEWGISTNRFPHEAYVRDFVVNEDGRVEIQFLDGMVSTPWRVVLAAPANPDKLASLNFGARRVPAGEDLIVGRPGTKSPSFGLLECGGLDLREIPEDLRAYYPQRRQFIQGSVEPSPLRGAMAVTGQGFFVVRDAAKTRSFATRAGCFSITEDGFFELPGGYRLQGLVPADAHPGELTDLRAVDSQPRESGAPDAGTTAQFLDITNEGEVRDESADATPVIVGQIRLQDFRHPESLRVQVLDPCGDQPEFPSVLWGPLDREALVPNGAIFDGYEEAGPQRPAGTNPGTHGVGMILHAFREQPNLAAGFALPDLRGGAAYRLEAGIVPMGFLPKVEASDDLIQWNTDPGTTLRSGHGLVVVNPPARPSNLASLGAPGAVGRFFRWSISDWWLPETASGAIRPLTDRRAPRWSQAQSRSPYRSTLAAD